MSRVVLLSDRWGWFGSHSGYDRFTDHLDQTSLRWVPAAQRRPSWAGNQISARLRGGAWCCTPRALEEEEQFLRLLEGDPAAVGHILYFERHHPMFRRQGLDLARIVATVHHPLAQSRRMHRELLQDLHHLKNAIVPWRKGAEELSDELGIPSTFFIHHGVDVSFFCPGGSRGDAAPSVLFVGENGRDLPMLIGLIRSIAQAHPHVHFDLVIPSLRQKPRSRLLLSPLWGNRRVRWWSGLSDEGLRNLYRTASVLLLPLKSSGACNAVVEAMACGLPIVTGPSEGIEDYGGGSLYPLAHDIHQMHALCMRYLREPRWRDEVSEAVRNFAVDVLPWERAAALHQEVYANL